MRVSANGGTPETLVEVSGALPVRPQILPDGNSVLFSLWTAFDQSQVVVQSLDTDEQKVLFEGVSAKYVSTGHIVYAEANALFAVPFDLATLEVVGGRVPIVEGIRLTATGGFHYDVSGSGSLVFLPDSGASGTERILALVDRNGEIERLNAAPKQYLSPRLSPDGTKLVVQSAEATGSTLWTYDLTEDRAIQQLTFEGDSHRPRWTPDGQRITFSSDRNGTMSLYSMPADGSGVAERLTTAQEGTSHWMGSWSPDGQTMVFNIQRELTTDWDIWTLSHDDGETESLYDMPGTIYLGAELSPDGRWLAYGAGPNSDAVDIYVEPFQPTGARRRISPAGENWPFWSPEGSELLYRPSSLLISGITLRSVDIVTAPNFGFSNERTLPIEGFTVVTFHRDYDMTPDGERFVMVFPAEQAESGEPIRPQINIVTNWFEELKQRVPVP